MKYKNNFPAAITRNFPTAMLLTAGEVPGQHCQPLAHNNRMWVGNTCQRTILAYKLCRQTQHRMVQRASPTIPSTPCNNHFQHRKQSLYQLSHCYKASVASLLMCIPHALFVYKSAFRIQHSGDCTGVHRYANTWATGGLKRWESVSPPCGCVWGRSGHGTWGNSGTR